MNLEKGTALITSFEGLRLKAYKCPKGVWTIGYGHTKGVKEGDIITKEKALNLLKEDIEHFTKGLKTLLEVSISENQFNALLSFVFNVCLNAFKKSTMRKYINLKQCIKASKEFDRWIYVNGKPSKGLIRRRLKEKELFLDNG